MARMSIDDMVQRDPRITKLSQLLGWSRRETVGCLVLDIWPICYDQCESEVLAELVNIAAGRDDFAAHMVSAGLASWSRGNRKIKITGAQKRIEYLDRKRESGRVGGLNSAESRRKNSSIASTSAQAPWNPPVPDPSSVPASASASVPDPVLRKEETSPPAPGVSASKPRKSKTRQFTTEQREIATRVLGRLSETNGVRYTGSDAHVALIVDRLNDGIHELELRAIVAHCASPKASGGKGWEESDEMRQYLCPETLFGPKTHTKYLDPARTQYRKQLDEQIGKSPQLRLVEGT